VPYGTSIWQVGYSTEHNGTFTIESKKANADTVRNKIGAGLPATLEKTTLIRIVNVAWQISFARVDTNKRSIAARGWGPLNYILLDHPELQETKERVHSINEIYAKQVRVGVVIIDLTLLNTEKGDMGICTEMFLDHKVQENELGKLSATEQKEMRRQAGLAKKAGGAQIFDGLVAITDGYAIGPECLAWTRCTRLEKERQAKAKQTAGRL
jgi:hypothetical protein